MISHEELGEIAKMRLKDAEVLHKGGNYDGSLYLCGYAIELGLKAIITRNLNFGGKLSTSHIPSTKEEFKIVGNITDHDLEKLLTFIPQNVIQGIKSKYLTEWSLIQKWNPEMRYAPIRGKSAKKEAAEVIKAVQRILNYLNKLP